MHYNSTLEYPSSTYKDVTYHLRRISFAGRLELLERLQSVAGKAEFLKAGNSPSDQYEATLLERQIERAYLEWSLVKVEGLLIDDEQATPEMLIEKGPESLIAEILANFKAQLGLTEDERKN